MSRAMKTSKIPFAPQIPETWREIPNRFLFLEHSSKVGERWKEYQLLSLTTSGVKEKSINDTGGKVPDSYENYQTVEKGDMVFCLFDLDCSAVFSGLSIYDGMITSAYDVFRTNEKYLDNTYARFWFDYVFSRRYYKMFSKNIRYTITADVFKSIYTPCPPIAEQKRIGAFLDKKCGEIDEMISLQEKIIEELKAYKQSIISEIACKGLNPRAQMRDSGYDWLGEIPQHWTVLKNRFLFKENVRQCTGNEVPLSLSQADGLIATDEMKEKAMKTSTFEGWKAVKVNDIVLNRFKAHLGVLFCAKLEGMVSFHYGVYEARTALVPQYFEYLYHSNQYRYIYAIKSNGMVVGLQNLSNTNFYSVDCLCPPINEQQAIADDLDEKCAEIDKLISVRQAKIEALKEYKKSIIYEYVTGKKEIQ